ncbi:MAG: hypothetical protein ACLSCO_14380 [Gallintestinimicrobium sp.]
MIGCEVMHRAMWQDVELSNEAEYVDGIFVSINPIILKIKKKLIEVAKRYGFLNLLSNMHVHVLH